MEKLGPHIELEVERYSFTSDEDSIKVYHGTTFPEIQKFKPADESTIGDGGIYFTLDKDLAEGYGLLRKEEREKHESEEKGAFLYEVNIDSSRILNLSDDSILKDILQVFRIFLLQYIEDCENLSEKYNLNPSVIKGRLWKKVILQSIEKIDNEEFHSGNLKELGSGILGKIFTDIVVNRLGYDGVAAWEGGDDKKHTSTPGISIVIYNESAIGNIAHSEI